MKPNNDLSERIYINAMKEAGEEIKFGLTASTNFDQNSQDSKRMAGNKVIPQYQVPGEKRQKRTVPKSPDDNYQLSDR